MRCNARVGAQVVLVAIYAARLGILLRRERVAITCGQMPIILSAHGVLFMIDRTLLTLYVRGFTRRPFHGLPKTHRMGFETSIQCVQKDRHGYLELGCGTARHYISLAYRNILVHRASGADAKAE